MQYKVELAALHITNGCSHKCPYCYVASNEGLNDQHGDLLVLKKIVDELDSAGVNEVNFLGGDPAIYPHVVELAKYVKEKGISPSILSNTHLYQKSSFNEALKYFDAFEATIHHHDERVHDHFCSKDGAFTQVTCALKKASDAGKKIGIAINVTPKTNDIIFDIVNCLYAKKKINISYVIIQRIIPTGRAASATCFTLSKNQAEKSLKNIERVDKELGISITVEDPFPLCILPNEMHKYMVPCAWGITKCAISSNGALSRCGADPSNTLGNILKTPLLALWNSAPALTAFRKKDYLPGRCHICKYLERCGGGCPLSCQVESSLGVDYLYLAFESRERNIHGRLTFDKARRDELSSMLQIEWSNFPGYSHLFSVDSIKKWYSHNPDIFYVMRDAGNWVLGYAAIVPISESLFRRICAGEFSALVEFPETDVFAEGVSSPYYHIEAIATIPNSTYQRAGSALIHDLGEMLLSKATYITASPMSDIGKRLCHYFNFAYSSTQHYGGNNYDIYVLDVAKNNLSNNLSNKIEKFW